MLPVYKYGMILVQYRYLLVPILNPVSLYSRAELKVEILLELECRSTIRHDRQRGIHY